MYVHDRVIKVKLCIIKLEEELRLTELVGQSVCLGSRHKRGEMGHIQIPQARWLRIPPVGPL